MAVNQQLLVVEAGGHCAKGGDVVWPNSTWGRNMTDHWQLTLYSQTIGNHAPLAANFSSPSLSWHHSIALRDRVSQQPYSAAIWYALGSGVAGEAGNLWLAASFSQFVNTTETRWYLRSGGALDPSPPMSTEEASGWVSEPAQPVPTLGGAVLTLPQCGPHDQRPLESKHADSMVVFDSAPLTSALYAHGKLSASVWVQSSAVDTDVTVKVTDVYPTGESMLVQDGNLRMRWRDGPNMRAAPLVPGRSYQVTIEIGYTSYLFSPGHRIRVAIASSNWPRFSVNLQNGDFMNGTSAAVAAKNAVLHDAEHSSVVIVPTLPVEVMQAWAI
jgi:predicted acyl esterase